MESRKKWNPNTGSLFSCAIEKNHGELRRELRRATRSGTPALRRLHLLVLETIEGVMFAHGESRRAQEFDHGESRRAPSLLFRLLRIFKLDLNLSRLRAY